MSVLQWLREAWGHFEAASSPLVLQLQPPSAGLERLPLKDAAVRFSEFSWFELISINRNASKTCRTSQSMHRWSAPQTHTHWDK